MICIRQLFRLCPAEELWLDDRGFAPCLRQRVPRRFPQGRRHRRTGVLHRLAKTTRPPTPGRRHERKPCHSATSGFAECPGASGPSTPASRSRAIWQQSCTTASRRALALQVSQLALAPIHSGMVLSEPPVTGCEVDSRATSRRSPPRRCRAQTTPAWIRTSAEDSCQRAVTASSEEDSRLRGWWLAECCTGADRRARAVVRHERAADRGDPKSRARWLRRQESGFAGGNRRKSAGPLLRARREDGNQDAWVCSGELGGEGGRPAALLAQVRPAQTPPATAGLRRLEQVEWETGLPGHANRRAEIPACRAGGAHLFGQAFFGRLPLRKQCPGR